jgi:hypothetical protein
MVAAGGAANTPAAWETLREQESPMHTLPSAPTRANPTPDRRQRKPLLPMQVQARFVGGAARQDILDGSAVLAIVSGDPTDSDETAYWLIALYDGDRCTGFRLTKFGTGEPYDVPRSLDACSCPDGTYRSERPGGCKHQQALRQALPTVANNAA